jgi:hypothetical protein
MQQRTVVLFVALFALIVIGMFAFAYLIKQEEVIAPTTVPTVPTVPAVSPDSPLPAVVPVGDSYSHITRIDAKHFFIDGVHTFAGSIDMPTPCDILSVEATVAESYPEQIRLNFSAVNTAEVCPQVIAPQRFLVSATSSAAAVIQATFMGRPVELNLVPAEAGELPGGTYGIFING